MPGARRTRFGRPGYLRRAMAASASGFVVKDTPARQLADAVRRVASGLRVVDPSLAAETLAAGDSPLTPRETDVLRTARDGKTVADIAAALHLSEGTVRNHLSAAMGKTGARTRAEAVRLASANGWLLGNDPSPWLCAGRPTTVRVLRTVRSARRRTLPGPSPSASASSAARSSPLSRSSRPWRSRRSEAWA